MKPQSIDAVTVACIAIVAYLVAAVVHEGLGHGVAAALLGARDIRLSGAVLRLDSQSVSPTASRIICIAGPLTGLLVGLLLALCQRYMKSNRAEFRYFLWLTAYVCLFANAGYFMALSLVPFGDIHGFVQGFDSPFAWRLGLTVVGTVLSILALLAAGRTLDEFLGQTERRRKAAKLMLISYFAGSIPLILSTLLGRDGSYVALVSAIPATLGGTIFLPYTILCVGKARKTTNPDPLTPQSSLLWYTAGVMALLVYVLILGPGVPR